MDMARNMRIQMVVEQPGNEPYRVKYIPEENRFVRTENLSLGYARGFHGVYGWVKGYGQPPEPHRDVFMICEADHAAGAVLEGKVVGCFLRGDGDHKLVCIAPERPEEDLTQLPDRELAMLRDLYPRIGEGEGWFDRVQALALLENPV